jgi:hypothetical protein
VFDRGWERIVYKFGMLQIGISTAGWRAARHDQIERLV